MPGPPQRPALHGCIAQHGKEKLHEPRGLERAVRKVAVVKPRYGEHPHPVGRHGHAHRQGAPADPQDPEATQVQGRKRQHAHPIDLPLIFGDRGDNSFVALKPAQESQSPAFEWRCIARDLCMFHSISRCQWFYPSLTLRSRWVIFGPLLAPGVIPAHAGIQPTRTGCTPAALEACPPRQDKGCVTSVALQYKTSLQYASFGNRLYRRKEFKQSRNSLRLAKVVAPARWRKRW